MVYMPLGYRGAFACSQIYKKVKPLMDALEAAQQAKSVAMANLAEVR